MPRITCQLMNIKPTCTVLRYLKVCCVFIFPSTNSSARSNIVSTVKQSHLFAPSSTKYPVSSYRRLKMWQCSVCLKDHNDFKSVHADGHVLCSQCLVTLFDNAIRNELDYPPKLSTLPLHPRDFDHLTAIDYEYIKKYSEKEEEYSVAPYQRVYCAHTYKPVTTGVNADKKISCGTFLGERKTPDHFKPNLVSAAKCPKCLTLTCIVCEELYSQLFAPLQHHCPGLSKRLSEEYRMLSGLQRGKHWQRCPNEQCRRVFELKEACNHLTCPCGTSYCFICGKEASAISKHWDKGGCPRYSK